MTKKIYILSAVTNATDNQKAEIDRYVQQLEENGNSVYLPHRDTNPNQEIVLINYDNFKAIQNCNEAHVFYDSTSKGSHFDLGMCFAMHKPIVVVKTDGIGEYAKFLQEIGKMP